MTFEEVFSVRVLRWTACSYLLTLPTLSLATCQKSQFFFSLLIKASLNNERLRLDLERQIDAVLHAKGNPFMAWKAVTAGAVQLQPDPGS